MNLAEGPQPAQGAVAERHVFHGEGQGGRLGSRRCACAFRVILRAGDQQLLAHPQRTGIGDAVGVLQTAHADPELPRDLHQVVAALDPIDDGRRRDRGRGRRRGRVGRRRGGRALRGGDRQRDGRRGRGRGGRQTRDHLAETAATGE